MTWTEVQVNHQELEAPQIWCHPAVKVNDRFTIFSSSKNPSNENSHESLTLQAYTLDCGQIMTHNCCTWQQRKDSIKALTATSLHSVVQARGEFLIFGGRTNLSDGAWKVVKTLNKNMST